MDYRSTDPALWTVRPQFGVAGGPDEIALTQEGEERAFSVGAQVRRGPAARALLDLWCARGIGRLSTRLGSRLTPTELGRYDQIVWGYLRELGYVESIPSEPGVHEDGVRLTAAGRAAAYAGIQQQAALLARCRRAAAGP